MNLQPETVSALRAMLLAQDDIEATITDLSAKIERADDACGRLGLTAVELDKQAKAAAKVHIDPDADRIARIVAGDSVPQVDKGDIEARARQLRQAEALRCQAAEDLAAVRTHLASLRSQLSDAEGARDAGFVRLLRAANEACYDSFKEGITALVEAHMPQLLTLADMIARRTGALPDSWHEIMGIRLGWYDRTQRNLKVDVSGNTFQRIDVWPRTGDKLHTGTVTLAPEILDDLLASLRASGSDGQAAEQPLEAVHA